MRLNDRVQRISHQDMYDDEDRPEGLVLAHDPNEPQASLVSWDKWPEATIVMWVNDDELMAVA